MKVRLVPQSNNVSKTEMQVCKKQRKVVSCNSIILNWELVICLNFLEYILYSKNKYRLEIESEESSLLESFKLQNANKITNLKKGENQFSFSIEFTPRNSSLGKNEINYQVKLIDENERLVSISDKNTINLNEIEFCCNCIKSSQDAIKIILNNDEGIVYSDNSYNRTDYHFATLIIDTTNDNLLQNHIKNCTLKLKILNGADYLPHRFDSNNNITNKYDCYAIEIPKDKTSINIPLLIDMNSIQLPEIKGINNKLTINYILSYRFCDQPIKIEKNIKCPITISDDFITLKVTTTELDINNQMVEKLILPNSNIRLSDIRLLNQPGGQIIKNIIISNPAKSINHHVAIAGLRIRNIKTILDIPEDEKKRIEGKGLWDISIQDEVILHSNENKSISLNFNFDEIDNIKIKNNCRYIDLKIIFQFDYKEDRIEQYIENGYQRYRIKDNGWTNFSCSFNTRIFRKEPTKWYSADFGTSAVVACCLNRRYGYNTIELIDLKLKKNQLLIETYPDEGDRVKREDYSESSDKLIGSMLYLNPTGNFDLKVESKLKQKDFRTQALWFSPASGMVDERYRLPCLKNMMGHTTIPQIPLLQGNKDEFLRAKVNDIMKYAYNQLFNYYINSEDNVETLVLTIPNTFTPIHIEQLKKIVLCNLTSLQEDMLEFVSESDSVLCSYIAERQKSCKRNELSEKVLVYDMGAGTLDLTYAICEFKEDGCNIDIVRKLGVNKAGNYIDYLLGEIIHSLIKTIDSKSSKKIENTPNHHWPDRIKKLLDLNPTQNKDYNSRKALKDYLRNTVKIMLNDEGNTKLPSHSFIVNSPPCNDFQYINISDILSHNFFTDYLHSCTTKVIEDLFSGIEKKVDVVLLSGRTISINAIRNSLEKVLGNKPKYLNMEDASGFTLKTIVAKGALDYMRMSHFSRSFNITKRKVYGCYGILTMSNNSPLKWFPLIDKDDKPIDESIDYTLYEYENSIVVEMEKAELICLCHSYCMNTLKDAKNGNFDSISFIHRYDISMHRESDTIGVYLKITSTNKLEYTIGNVHINDLFPRDDYNNESLKKSLWPVIYN